MVVGASALRLLLLALGPPFPGPQSPLLSPDIYASTLPGPGWLSEPLRSPLDLLLTVAWMLLLALALLRRALAAGREPSYARALAGRPGSAAAARDRVRLHARHLHQLLARPRGAVAAAPRAARCSRCTWRWLVVLGIGGALLAALLGLGRPVRRAARAASCCARPPGRCSARQPIGSGRATSSDLPLVPALALFLPGGARRQTCRCARAALRCGPAGSSLAGAALAAALALPEPRPLRREEHAPPDRARPRAARPAPAAVARVRARGDARARSTRSSSSRRRLRARNRPLLEELAFAVWSGTDLAALRLLLGRSRSRTRRGA